MPAQFWESTLSSPAVTTDGTAYASSTTLTVISPSSSTQPDVTIPANYLYPGQILRVVGTGRFSTTGTPNLTLGAYWGGVSGVALATTGTLATSSGASNLSWMFEMWITCRTTGTSGTAMAMGQATGITAATATALIPASAPVVATIDTTVAKTLVLGATWGSNSASNTITCHQWIVEALN